MTPLDGPGQARDDDLATAKAAAGWVRPGSARRLLLETHRGHPQGLTDEEAAEASGISLTSEYATRCSELQRRGLLENTNGTRAGRSGPARVVRRITRLGLQSLRVEAEAVVSPRRGSPPDCSCGRGPVGHTTEHESTDRPGIVRMIREGKTDQYLNLRAIEAQSRSDAVKATREDEQRRKAKTPRVDPSTHRLTFGGPVICRKCGGTGGSLLEACYMCGGTGLT